MVRAGCGRRRCVRLGACSLVRVGACPGRSAAPPCSPDRLPPVLRLACFLLWLVPAPAAGQQRGEDEHDRRAQRLPHRRVGLHAPPAGSSRRGAAGAHKGWLPDVAGPALRAPGCILTRPAASTLPPSLAPPAGAQAAAAHAVPGRAAAVRRRQGVPAATAAAAAEPHQVQQRRLRRRMRRCDAAPLPEPASGRPAQRCPRPGPRAIAARRAAAAAGRPPAPWRPSLLYFCLRCPASNSNTPVSSTPAMPPSLRLLPSAC